MQQSCRNTRPPVEALVGASAAVNDAGGAHRSPGLIADNDLEAVAAAAALVASGVLGHEQEGHLDAAVYLQYSAVHGSTVWQQGKARRIAEQPLQQHGSQQHSHTQRGKMCAMLLWWLGAPTWGSTPGP
jgi:hypothetical protein